MDKSNSEKILILSPVFNDWNAFNYLIKDIDSSLARIHHISILAINDGSNIKCNLKFNCKNIFSIKTINLKANMGHQRAIAIGLSSIDTGKYSSVVVMDCDGEDKVSDINSLIQKSKKTKEIVVARRKWRSETVLFKTFYFFYKLVFRVMTGRNINFGNFSILPVESIASICNSSELWNNYPATLLKLKLPLKFLDVSRGSRYSGSSKMNLTSLISHGLSAVSVFLELVLIRTLVVFTILMISLFLVILTELFIDLSLISDFTFHTLIVYSIIIFIFNSFLLVKVLISLNQRAIVHDPIIMSYSKYILNINSIYKKNSKNI